MQTQCIWIIVFSQIVLEKLVGAKSSQPAKIHYFNRFEQWDNLQKANQSCLARIAAASDKDKSDETTTAASFCPMNFDGAACWPETQANTTAVLQCPDYINSFDSSQIASRFCDEFGAWPTDQRTGIWRVDYSLCMRAAKWLNSSTESSKISSRIVPPAVRKHLPHMAMLAKVGYSISVIFVSVALIILLSLKRLHCPRNTIHINMFISFMLRGIIHLVSDHVNDLTGKDQILQEYEYAKNPDSNTKSWECKMVATIWMYSRLSNYIWIFVEGFYLHTLIFINTFSHKSSIKWFLICGWGTPVIFVLPWLFVRIFVDDDECWVTYKNSSFRWIIEVPIAASIVVNFIFFLIIIRLLFTKLKGSEMNSTETRIYRYIKLAKATLVLVPLFGTHYIVFLFAEFSRSSNTNGTLEVVRIYFDSFMTSFQGLMVSFMFCFMNGEIRAEITKKWKRWKINRGHGLLTSNVQNNTMETHHRISLGSESSLEERRRASRVCSHSSSYQEAIPEETCLVDDTSERDINQNNVLLNIPTTKNGNIRVNSLCE